MHFHTTLYQSMYEHNDKQYIRVKLDETATLAVARTHEKKRHYLRSSNIENPLTGNILTLKIPYRYRRVMCQVTGGTPVQALKPGDAMEIDAEFTPWNAGDHSGFSWKCIKIST